MVFGNNYQLLLGIGKPSQFRKLNVKLLYSPVSFKYKSNHIFGEIHRNGNALIAFYIEEFNSNNDLVSRNSCIPIYSKKLVYSSSLKHFIDKLLISFE